MSISAKLKLGVLAAVISTISLGAAAKDFLNVSYDPTRELYEERKQRLRQILGKPYRTKN